MWIGGALGSSRNSGCMVSAAGGRELCEKVQMFFCMFGSGNLLLESSWFGVLPCSLCWCELGGALMLNFVFLAGEVCV